MKVLKNITYDLLIEENKEKELRIQNIEKQISILLFKQDNPPKYKIGDKTDRVLIIDRKIETTSLHSFLIANYLDYYSKWVYKCFDKENNKQFYLGEKSFDELSNKKKIKTE